MIISIDRKGLESLVKGSNPAYKDFNNPLVKKAGHSYNDQYGRTSWGNIDALTEQELYELYLICHSNQDIICTHYAIGRKNSGDKYGTCLLCGKIDCE